jgi:hypothetical protein
VEARGQDRGGEDLAVSNTTREAAAGCRVEPTLVVRIRRMRKSSKLRRPRNELCASVARETDGRQQGGRSDREVGPATGGGNSLKVKSPRVKPACNKAGR